MAGHTGFRNEELFCFNCGGSFKIHYPIPVGDVSVIIAGFEALHKHCPKTWEEPILDGNGKTEKENADKWLSDGEQGLSSKTIFKYLGDVNLLGRWGDHHPSDPDDFKRCYKLLKAVPQWQSKFHKMKDVSPVWSNLVDNWDKLTDMYEQNVREDWKNYKKVGMYEFMKSLGC